MLYCVLTGFASGLPFYFLINLIPAWQRDQGVDLKSIGLLALVQFPYTWKFLWAPLLDRYHVPLLGRRRGWMLLTQILLLAVMLSFSWLAPQPDLQTVALLAIGVAFFSASQDIVLDAYRRELLQEQQFGLGNAIHVNGFRISGLVPGALALVLSDHMPWSTVFQIVAGFMTLGIFLTLWAPEPSHRGQPPMRLEQAVVEPFKEFFQRQGTGSALLILAFMFLYKLGDSMAVALATPFYMDMGFSNTAIGLVTKNATLWPAVIGGMLGGIWMLKLGINRALWLFGLAQISSILLFALFSALPAEQLNLYWLAGVITWEYLAIGCGTAAFTAFIFRLANPAFVATQIALLTALALIPRVFVSASTGYLVEAMGWTQFYLLCALVAVPGMLLLLKVAPWHEPKDAAVANAEPR
ncbi:AmpG family muropeptide MFS transporter [Permianibacter sp. IMCC34836]|nr:AmpG family muropeptide MFS transporter [Permianibacter fluminis]